MSVFIESQISNNKKESSQFYLLLRFEFDIKDCRTWVNFAVQELDQYLLDLDKRTTRKSLELFF